MEQFRLGGHEDGAVVGCSMIGGKQRIGVVVGYSVVEDFYYTRHPAKSATTGSTEGYYYWQRVKAVHPLIALALTAEENIGE